MEMCNEHACQGNGMKVAAVADDGLMGSSVLKNRASRDHVNSLVVVERAGGQVVYQRFWGDVGRSC